MTITISPFIAAEAEATDEVVRAAYGVEQSRKDSLLSYLAFEGAASFVAKEGEAVVGFGGVLDYGPFAYIGLMSVAPAVQRRGVGQMLMERLMGWLEERNCPTVLLDATPVGEPLYRGNGFEEDDRTVVWQKREHVLLPRHLPLGVSRLAETDIPALIAFDAAHFGADRGQVLRMYCARYAGRVLVVRGEDGRINGYAIAQAHVIGPIVAQNKEDAERLLVHALALPFEGTPGIFVSANHQDASRLLMRYGFSQQRTLSHMWAGKHIERKRRTTLYGQVSLGLG